MASEFSVDMAMVNFHSAGSSSTHLARSASMLAAVHNIEIGSISSLVLMEARRLTNRETMLASLQAGRSPSTWYALEFSNHSSMSAGMFSLFCRLFMNFG